ncbi:hypothetical protein [Methanosarcina acetivorans]|uniref:Zona occludens toxin N-terminal domain-containing protein n=1 Tax=Methanosarcina acetivorans (strain ATCC 35395 / DSM 2834 / JCM 12185 / C2A) TaxID=188937 RepID=Q8TQI4_METAC|nr:hypothetical protein [Methanosarcina acetivorans]AAM04972.1 predicted protein [Methanosarcina acetivorans C2A]
MKPSLDERARVHEDVDATDLLKNFEFKDFEEEPGISRKMNYLALFNLQAKAKMTDAINDSSFFAFLGDRGTGKSTMSICQAFAIDPDFDPANVCFSFEELKEIITNKRKVPAVWEEAGVGAYSRDFMNQVNKDLNKFFQVFRYRRIAVIANFQHLSLLDNHTRLQLDVAFWNMSKVYHTPDGKPYARKFTMPYKVLKTPFTDPIVKPYKVYGKGPNMEEIGIILLPIEKDMLEMYGVSNAFMHEYQKRKHEFFTEMLDKEDEPKPNPRQAKVIERQLEAFRTVAHNLILKHGMSKRQVAEFMEIPRTTLNDWGIFNSD